MSVLKPEPTALQSSFPDAGVSVRPPRFYYYFIMLSCGFCMKARKQTTGKTENNTVKLCPAPPGTSGEGTVKAVNSIFHSPQLRPGTILSILCCFCEDKLLFDFFFIYRMSIWSKYVLANLQCLALGNCYLSVL